MEVTPTVSKTVREETRTLLFGRRTAAALTRLEADPNALAEYRDEAQGLAEVEVAVNDRRE